jgi:hypothetical protein
MLRCFVRSIILAGACAIFAIGSVSRAAADECDVLYDKWTAKHPRPELPKTLTEMTDGNANDMFGNKVVFPGLTESDLKAYCAYEKVYLENRRRDLEDMAYIDRTCVPRRITWPVCDLQCNRNHLREDEQRFAKECAPDKFAERYKSDHEDEWDKSCRNAEYAKPPDTANPEWKNWIESCNKLAVCSDAWLAMEKSGLPTEGLTCPPTKAQRAKFTADLNPPPVAPRTADEQREISCSLLIASATYEYPNLPKYLSECNAAKACTKTREQLQTFSKMSGGTNKSIDAAAAKLTCDGKPLGEASSR